jgi:hypothetical protein
MGGRQLCVGIARLTAPLLAGSCAAHALQLACWLLAKLAAGACARLGLGVQLNCGGGGICGGSTQASGLASRSQSRMRMTKRTVKTPSFAPLSKYLRARSCRHCTTAWRCVSERDWCC